MSWNDLIILFYIKISYIFPCYHIIGNQSEAIFAQTMNFCFILTEKYCKSSQDNYTIDLLVATCNTNIDVKEKRVKTCKRKKRNDGHCCGSVYLGKLTCTCIIDH